MVITSMTAVNLAFPETADAVKARASTENESGAINGAPIEVLTCDDKNDPNTAADCAREAVQNKVAAIVGGYSLQGATIFPILEAAGIPNVGGTVNTPTDLNSKMSFPVDSVLSTAFYAASKALLNEGCTKIGMVAAQSAALSTLITGATTALTKDQYVGEALYPISGPTGDVAPLANTLLSKGADCILLPVNYTLQDQFANAFAQINPRVKFATSFAATPANWGQSLKQANKYTVVGSFLPLESTEPGMVQFKTQMAARAKGALQNGYSLRSWIAAGVFASVARTVKGDVTASTMVAALNGASKIDTGGLSYPIDFTKPHSSTGVTREFNTFLITQGLKDGVVKATTGFVDYAHS
jgi:ABC-type branched-subunit amino acid transport system substrate-binding protein